MLRLTRRSLWDHKRRLLATLLSVVLGVAFLTGTNIFGDTVDRSFENLFADANEEIDAVVQGDALFASSFGGNNREPMDAAVVDAVREVDGVERAAPYVITLGFGPRNRVLDPAGDPVGVDMGPPTLFESWIDDPELTAYDVTEGRGPEADDEVALNVAAADEAGYAVGDEVKVLASTGDGESLTNTYTLVGIVRFSGEDSSGGAVSAEFTLAEAQRLAGIEGRINEVHAAGDGSLTAEEVVDRIRPVIPDKTNVITGEAAALQLAGDVTEGFEFFQQFIQVFVYLALLVSVFVIYNTFSILVAQRTRELALLRSIGASRSQVLGSVALEGVLVGIIAGAIGVVGGIALATAIRAALMGGTGDIPQNALVVNPGTLLASLLTGVFVTAVAAIVPAVRATRVPPIAALRTVEATQPRISKPRIAFAGVVLVLAVLNLSQAWTADGDTDAIPAVGLGAALAMMAAIIAGPLFAEPTVRALGGLLPRLRGVTGRLAQENAARNPKRTSATASALLIGVALIGFVTVFAESAQASLPSEVERGIRSDLVVTASFGFGGGFAGFAPSVVDRVAAVDGVADVTSLNFAEAVVTTPKGDELNAFTFGIDPKASGSLISPRMAEGKVSDLTADGAIVDQQTAEDNDLAIGDEVEFLLAGGARLDVTIRAISDDLVVLSGWTLERSTLAKAVPEDQEVQTYLEVAEGADIEEVKAAAREAVADVPTVKVQDIEEFTDDFVEQITFFVQIINALLALSIIIALIGIANTLSLSIYERTREVGLLRAVGMTQPQVRSAVRWEAVLIAVLGTLVGLGLGLVLSFVLVQALESFGLRSYTVPFGSLLFQVVVAAILAVGASILPARRASRLDVLEAIGTE